MAIITSIGCHFIPDKFKRTKYEETQPTYIILSLALIALSYLYIQYLYVVLHKNKHFPIFETKVRIENVYFKF